MMPSKITAIIVDDEQEARIGFELMVNRTHPNLEIIDKANNAQTALEQIIDKHPDLLFLDVEMPVHNGFWLADKLKHFENETDIIFITAHNEYAIKAIKYAAFDFLIKPVISEELKETIERYQNKNKQEDIIQKLEKLSSYMNSERIKLNTQNGFVILKREDIVFCSADGNYTMLHLTNGKKELVSMHLKLVEEKLGSNNFLRISRSHTINLDYLDSFNRKTKRVVLQDDLQQYELKASRSGAKALMRI